MKHPIQLQLIETLKAIITNYFMNKQRERTRDETQVYLPTQDTDQSFVWGNF